MNYLFGFPNTIEPGGIEMDLDSVSTFTGLDTYDKATLKAFVQQTGTLSSALEHAVPEQMFTSPENPGEAVSVIKALALANAQGQRTYHITQANQLTALPNINHDASTMSEIQSALAVGKEVITHTDSITLNGWTGAGYIILDSDTGSGAYKVSGGTNGAWIFFTILSFIMFAVLFQFLLAALIYTFFISVSQGVILAVLYYTSYSLVNGIQNAYETCDTTSEYTEAVASIIVVSIMQTFLDAVGSAISVFIDSAIFNVNDFIVNEVCN